MYQEIITEGVNQALNDELTSATLYYNISEYLVGVHFEEVRNEMGIHGDEEMEHFKSLLTYAHSHGITPKICLDEEIANKQPEDFFEVTGLIQSLETKAIELYERLSACAQEHGDIESHHFFKGLMEKEMEHFDDLAKLTGEKRPLSKFDGIKSYSAMSFSDFLKSMEDEKSVGSVGSADNIEIEIEPIQ